MLSWRISRECLHGLSVSHWLTWTRGAHQVREPGKGPVQHHHLISGLFSFKPSESPLYTYKALANNGGQMPFTLYWRLQALKTLLSWGMVVVFQLVSLPLQTLISPTGQKITTTLLFDKVLRDCSLQLQVGGICPPHFCRYIIYTEGFVKGGEK